MSAGGPVEYGDAGPAGHGGAGPVEYGDADPAGHWGAGGPGEPVAGGGQRPVSPATYWRRRALALALGIGLLTILAWAVSGILGGGRAAGQAGGSGAAVAGPGNHSRGTGSGRAQPGHGGSGHAGTGHTGTGHAGAGGTRHGVSGHGAAAVGRPGLTGLMTGQPGSGAGRAGTAAGAGRGAAPRAPANPVRGGSPAGAHSATRPPRVRPSPRPSTGHGAAAPHGGPAPGCAPGNVALSLFTPKYWYERGQQPQFVIAATSTSAQPCRFNMGARYVSVVISYDGSRIWSSADCARGSGSRSVVLAPGRLAISWITWDRETSVPGCRPASHAVRGGTYVVTAASGRLRSRGMIIVLSAPGIAVP